MNSNTVASQSQITSAKDEKTYQITLTADQRKLLMYSGIALAGYFLIRSLINSAVKKLNKDDD